MPQDELDKKTLAQLTELKENIAANLRRQRKKLELTQERIAEECGVNVSIVQRLETARLNDPVLSTFVKICWGYQLSIKELLAPPRK